MNKEIIHQDLVKRMEAYTEGLCPRGDKNFCGKKNMVQGKYVTCGECFINYILEQIEKSEVK